MKIDAAQIPKKVTVKLRAALFRHHMDADKALAAALSAWPGAVIGMKRPEIIALPLPKEKQG